MKTKEAFAAARIATGQADDPPQEKFNPVQGKLPGMPAKPKPVRGRLMLVTFVRPHFDRPAKGDPLISLDFSLPLSADHEGLIPDEIEDNWEVMVRKNAKRIDVENIDPQTVKVHLVPDDKPDLILESADVKKATLTIVQEKGKGKSTKVIRLAIRITTSRTNAIRDFIWNNDGEFCWLELASAQVKLL